MRRVSTFISVLMIVVTTIAVSHLNAQSCNGNGDVGGAYAFVGSRVMFPGVPVTPPGTSGATDTSTGGNSTGSSTGTISSTPVTVSNTPLGQLIGGMSGTLPFAVVGRIVADGAGNLLAASSPTGALTSVGTYTVNSDCSVSMTLNDVFIGMPVTAPGTAGSSSSSTGNSSSSSTGSSTGTSTGTGTTSGSTTTATPATLTVQGMVLNSGAEIDLTQTAASNTGAVIMLRRTLQFSGCTESNVSGVFGLVLQWSTSSTTSSTTTGTSPGTTSSSSLGVLSFIGRLSANGGGLFIKDALATQSPLPNYSLPARTL